MSTMQYIVLVVLTVGLIPANAYVPITGFCESDADCISEEGADVSCCAQWNIGMPVRVCKPLREAGEVCPMNAPAYPLTNEGRHTSFCPCHEGLECRRVRGQRLVGRCQDAALPAAH